MTSIHLFHIETLKSAFQNNLQTLCSILEKSDFVRLKLKELKQNYDTMVGNNKKKNIFILLRFLLFSIQNIVIRD